MASIDRKTRGRQKVAMVRMEKESNRLVTFSKRRSGLFKKASELCTLCGTEAAIVVFSPGKKAFSFGHPSVDTILSRFLAVDPPFSNRAIGRSQISNRNANLSRINLQLTILNTRVDDERKHSEELVKSRKSKGEDPWWLSPLEDIPLEHLKQLQGSISELKTYVHEFYNKLIVEATNSNSLAFAGPNAIGSGYRLPPNMVGAQNQSQMVMGSNPMGPGHSSSSMPFLMGGFDASSNALSFQGANNPIGAQLNEPPIPLNMVGMNMNMNISGNFDTFASLLTMDGPMGQPNTTHVGLGFGPGFY